MTLNLQKMKQEGTLVPSCFLFLTEKGYQKPVAGHPLQKGKNVAIGEGISIYSNDI